jgi:hypothetical protein
MGAFKEQEKTRQAQFKASSPYFSDAARVDGAYQGKPRQFCLPVDHADENLFSEIRQTTLEYFALESIQWHDGQDGNPSNHLCDSQVCCVNFLFPFASRPSELAALLRPIFPRIRTMIPIERGQYVAFEWIGLKDYLGETTSATGKRTRGAHFTSADAIVMFERTDGKRQAVLIEWKYAESYGSSSIRVSGKGTDRSNTYVPLFERDDCPINKTLLPSFGALFYEPFYQLMRQQVLAHEMELAQELSATRVCVLHIAPAHNSDFRRVTSPELQPLGGTATQVWGKLVRPRDRFVCVSTEQLFEKLSVEQLPGMEAWLEYFGARYAWVLESTVPHS